MSKTEQAGDRETAPVDAAELREREKRLKRQRRGKKPASLDLPAILHASRELEEAIRAYSYKNEPDAEFWAVLINRAWKTDRALNPNRKGYGDTSRDDHFLSLPLLQSGPLSRIRRVVDEVACTFGLAGVFGREDLEAVLAKAREHAAKADYTAMRVDRSLADELHSSVAVMSVPEQEGTDPRGTAQDPTPGGAKNMGQPESSPKSPSDKAFQAHLLYQLGWTQAKVAAELSKKHARPIAQGQVSKWLASVKEWTAAGNKLPEVSAPPRLAGKPVSMDPETLNMGDRVDHRTPRQRDKYQEGEDDWG